MAAGICVPRVEGKCLSGHWGKERELAGMGCEAAMLPAKRLPGHRTQGAGKQLYLQAVGAITESATRGQWFPEASLAQLRPQRENRGSQVRDRTPKAQGLRPWLELERKVGMEGLPRWRYW